MQYSAAVSSANNGIKLIPSGIVTFLNGSTPIGMATLSNGMATFDAGSSLAAGVDSIRAEYSGDSLFGANTSPPLIQTIAAPSVVTLVSNENPSVTNDDVIFTATVSGNDVPGHLPSGNVEFFDNGAELGVRAIDSNGTATFDTSGSLGIGSHSITAQYQGDSTFAASLSNILSQTVNQPDLVPVVLATTLPTTIVAGTSVHGNVTIALTNQNASTVRVAQITVFATSNQSITGAFPLASEASTHGISVGAHQTVDVKLAAKSFPASVGDGTYQLLAQVTTAMGHTSDSATGPLVELAAPFVRLAGTSGTGIVNPNPSKPGNPISLTLSLTNFGNIASGAASLTIGLSTDGQTESTVLATPTANINIKARSNSLFRLHFKIPNTVRAGTYFPFVNIADKGDVATIIGQSFTID